MAVDRYTHPRAPTVEEIAEAQAATARGDRNALLFLLAVATVAALVWACIIAL